MLRNKNLFTCRIMNAKSQENVSTSNQNYGLQLIGLNFEFRKVKDLKQTQKSMQMEVQEVNILHMFTISVQILSLRKQIDPFNG